MIVRLFSYSEERDVYELMLIQKKSMSVNDYRKRIGSYDKLTDDLSVEEVEKLVRKLIF